MGVKSYSRIMKKKSLGLDTKGGQGQGLRRRCDSV
jgi:hypothetical protein